MQKYSKIVAILIFLFLGYFTCTLYSKLELIAAFSAKNVASAHFINKRSLENIEKSDNDFLIIDWASNKINESEKFVTATVLGLKERKAIYRQGLGATLINNDFDSNKPYEIPKRIQFKNNLPFPYGNLEPKDTLFSNVNYAKLNKAVAKCI